MSVMSIERDLYRVYRLGTWCVSARECIFTKHHPKPLYTRPKVVSLPKGRDTQIHFHPRIHIETPRLQKWAKSLPGKCVGRTGRWGRMGHEAEGETWRVMRRTGGGGFIRGGIDLELQCPDYKAGISWLSHFNVLIITPQEAFDTTLMSSHASWYNSTWNVLSCILRTYITSNVLSSILIQP